MISYVIRFLSQYLVTPLFLSGVDVVTITQMWIISSIIDSILFITAIIFLAYHGITNKDTSMLIAGILQIFLLSILIIFSLSFDILL